MFGTTKTTKKLAIFVTFVSFVLCACFELPAAETANAAAAATTSAAIPPTQYLRCFIQTPFWWDGQS